MNVMNLILAVTAAAAVTATEEELPEVEIPVVTAPKVEVPVVEIPKVDVPEVERPVIIVPGVTGMEIVGSGEASTAGVTVPQVASVSDRVPEMMKMIRTAKSFADQRNLRFEPEISLDSAVWRKWMKIYQSNQPYTPAYKELPQGLRIIAEVKCPEDEGQEATLGKNLDFYAKQGYNAALLTFDTTENIDRLLETAKIIRAHGMKIVCAYSGPEKLRWSIYRDPDVIEQYVSRVCAVSDAFLIGWCRTSAHLLIMDRPFRDHLLRAARKLNPDVAIIGEAFYGETALNRRTVTYNVPDNASAVLLFGIGYKASQSNWQWTECSTKSNTCRESVWRSGKNRILTRRTTPAGRSRRISGSSSGSNGASGKAGAWPRSRSAATARTEYMTRRSPKT